MRTSNRYRLVLCGLDLDGKSSSECVFGRFVVCDEGGNALPLLNFV